MSDPKEPTIHLSSCREDGRCPECGGSVMITRAVLPCGCRWHQDCSTITAGNGVAFLGHTLDLLTEALRQLSDQRERGDQAEAARATQLTESIEALQRVERERDAAIRQVEEQRHPCPCGKDTASIKWARCYSCRQRDEELEVMREERDAAIREHQRALGEAAEIAQGLQSKLDEAIRERDLARAHDAQPYPTADEWVCAALEATKRSLEQTRAAMEAGDACTVCAGTGKPVSGKPCICGGHGGIGNQIIGLTREAQRERERADRAEALLREIAAVPLVGLTLGSVLLAKIREVVR